MYLYPGGADDLKFVNKQMSMRKSWVNIHVYLDVQSKRRFVEILNNHTFLDVLNKRQFVEIQNKCCCRSSEQTLILI